MFVEFKLEKNKNIFQRIFNNFFETLRNIKQWFMIIIDIVNCPRLGSQPHFSHFLRPDYWTLSYVLSISRFNRKRIVSYGREFFDDKMFTFLPTLSNEWVPLCRFARQMESGGADRIQRLWNPKSSFTER